MPITLRTVAPEELADVAPIMDGVMQRAYAAPSFRRQIEWYAAAQPDGLVVALDGDVIVGTGCGIAYADAGFGWIGVIATEPAYERRGIGAMLTERVAEVLATHGCASALDASAAGAPLYARMGFTDHGSTRTMSVPLGPATHQRVELLTTTNLAEAAAYDADVFGADRSRLLSVLVAGYPGRSGLVRRSDGAVAGIVIAQHAQIGPLAADDVGSLAELLSFAGALPWEAGARIGVPPGSRHVDTLLGLGCEPIRDLRHMRRNLSTLPGDQARYASRISLGIG